ncbi:MAG TPA: LytTR family DNA-binding domain-containing protein [Burkholderiaceae bacterium]|jgi:two-component system LytT family response regulator
MGNDITIRALIVDDEEPGRDNLRYALGAHSNWHIAAECANAAQAREKLAAMQIDVVFLDIRMPRESGLELARSMVEQDEPPLIVFVTAYDAFAIEAFEIHALDYLLKPFDDERLTQTLERAAAMLALHQRRPYGRALKSYLDENERTLSTTGPDYLKQLSVRSVGKIESVRMEDVLWIAAAGNYVELHTDGRAILHRIPLSKLADRLNPQEFIRVHRGAICRVDQLSSLAVAGDGSYLLALRCEDRLAVSERYVDAVRARMA